MLIFEKQLIGSYTTVTMTTDTRHGADECRTLTQCFIAMLYDRPRDVNTSKRFRFRVLLKDPRSVQVFPRNHQGYRSTRLRSTPNISILYTFPPWLSAWTFLTQVEAFFRRPNTFPNRTEQEISVGKRLGGVRGADFRRESQSEGLESQSEQIEPSLPWEFTQLARTKWMTPCGANPGR